MVTPSSSPSSSRSRIDGQRRDLVVPFTTRRPQPELVVHRHSERLHQRARVLAEALLARHERVAVMRVLHLALLQVVGEADVVVRRRAAGRCLRARATRGCASISPGSASCSETRWSSPKTIRVSRVGEDPLVDRQPVARLVDALEHGHRMAGRPPRRRCWKLSVGAVEQLQRAGDALQEAASRSHSRRLEGRPERPGGPRSWSRSGCPARVEVAVAPPTDSSRSSRC